MDAFPELLNIIPGTKDENEVRFRDLKHFLIELAAAPDLVKIVRERAALKITAEKGQSDFSDRWSTQCVSGHEEGAES